MQRESTNGISLIRAPGSLPPKRRRRQLTISAGPGQSSRLRGDGEQGQMRPVPNNHSFSLPYSFTHKQNEEEGHTQQLLRQRIWHGGPVKLLSHFCVLTWHHMRYECLPQRRRWSSRSGSEGVQKARRIWKTCAKSSVLSQFNWLARLKFFSGFQASGTKKAQHPKTVRVCCQTEV